MFCPTKEQTLAGVLALLPHGRAWQSNDGGPEPFHDAAFDAEAFEPTAFDTESRPGTILFRFWAAFAAVVHFANERLCALALEMFCATQSETRDQWMTEYDLPNACDPFPDLCTKVSAVGSQRCEYFAEVASRSGWSVACDDSADRCGDVAGCGLAGRAQAGMQRGAALRLIVDLNESPSFTGGTQTPPIAGRLQAGMPLACEPNITPLQCIMERIAPAHVTVEYLVLN
jgi:hypothetical protein